jgi:hypothetical protein
VQTDSNTSTSSDTNETSQVRDVLSPKTQALPTGGEYRFDQAIALRSDEDNVTIYYTIDGSMPTENSLIYNSEINISKTTTLKFFAKDKAGNKESIKSEIYTIDASLVKELYSFSISGEELKEASDLAYNDEIDTLYIVGDKGVLYSYALLLKDMNHIVELQYINEHNITHTNENFVIDSEGLTLDNTQSLIISLEGEPRVSDLSVNGVMDTNMTLPVALSDSSVYHNSNAIFEAVAFHDTYGVLVAAEVPINNVPRVQQTIYALSGEVWHFNAEAYVNSAVTGMEVMDDGNILILERAQDGNDENNFYLTLKKVYIDECNSENICKNKVIYSDRIYVQNYEGITKIGKDRYLIVADNQNASFLGVYLATYFKYFEIK